MKNLRHTIILVDDNVSNLNQGRSILRTFYKVYPAQSAAVLFEILESVIPDLILMDIEMPEIDGYMAVRKLKADERFSHIPVIFLTVKQDEQSEVEGFDLGAVDYVIKPFSAPILLKRIENNLQIVQIQTALRDYADNLEAKVRENTTKVIHLQNAVLSTVVDLVEFRDKHTGGHIIRTQRYLKALIDEMNKQGIYEEHIAKWDLDLLLLSAQLHDVGKIAISDLILNKPGKLTPEEFEIMKTHVSVGVDAIDKIMDNAQEHEFLKYALLIAGTHHEKWDGSGYPVGLRGRDIPLEGRLMAIADVYDALISERPYKNAFSHEEAVKIIMDSAGSHFEPDIANVFRNVEAEFAQAARKNLN